MIKCADSSTLQTLNDSIQVTHNLAQLVQPSHDLLPLIFSYLPPSFCLHTLTRVSRLFHNLVHWHTSSMALSTRHSKEALMVKAKALQRLELLVPHLHKQGFFKGLKALKLHFYRCKDTCFNDEIFYKPQQQDQQQQEQHKQEEVTYGLVRLNALHLNAMWKITSAKIHNNAPSSSLDDHSSLVQQQQQQQHFTGASAGWKHLSFNCCTNLTSLQLLTHVSNNPTTTTATITNMTSTTTTTALPTTLPVPTTSIPCNLFTTLVSLNLSYTKISNKHLNEDILSRLPNLKTLKAKGCTQLKHIYIASNQLETLNLRMCSNFTTATRRQVDPLLLLTVQQPTASSTAALPQQLKNANLLGTAVTAQSLEEVFEQFAAPAIVGVSSSTGNASLESVELRRCEKIKFDNDVDTAIMEQIAIKYWPNLKSLYLARTHVTDDMVEQVILKQCKQLKELEISRCMSLQNLTNIEHDNLQVLYLDGSTNIQSNLCIKRCPKICKLNLYGLANLTVQGVVSNCIATCINSLQRIDVRGCQFTRAELKLQLEQQIQDKEATNKLFIYAN